MNSRRVSVLQAAVIGLLVVIAFSVAMGMGKPRNICGETATIRQEKPEATHTTGNSGLKATSIRTLTMGKNGLWIGYATGIDPKGVGVSHFDGKLWRFCGQMPHVNAIALDAQGNPWVGTDAPLVGTPPTLQKSLMHFDGKTWVDHTQNLPDYRVYGLTFHDSKLYIATWSGVAVFDGSQWSVPYSRAKNLFDEHIHAIAFHGDDTFFGSIEHGGTWLHNGVYIPLENYQFTSASALHELGGDKIRRITISPSGDQVWFAIDGGDVTMYNYTTNKWTRFPVPDNRVNDVEFDYLARPWIATTGGVFYFDHESWVAVDKRPAYAVTFGCDGCPLPREQYFIGTISDGLAHGNVPSN